MRLLVIGASGFLGTHIRKRAEAIGMTVVTAGRSALPDSPEHRSIDLAADDWSVSRSAALRPHHPSDHRSDHPSEHPSEIAELLASIRPDVVVNCAGATGGDTEALAAVNVTGTHALVRAMLRAGRPADQPADRLAGQLAGPLAGLRAGRPAGLRAGLRAGRSAWRAAGRPMRLVHLGSAAEYGRVEPGVPVTERVPARPVGAYGATKLAGTRLVELAADAGLDAVVLRVFNPVGAGAPPSGLPGRVTAELRRALADGGEVRLGALDAVRDFVDADDVADAVLAAATAPALPHPVLNVGSGRGVMVRELVKQLVEISGYTGTVHEGAAGSARSADVPWQQADIARARRDLDWHPHRELSASLTELWEANR